MTGGKPVIGEKTHLVAFTKKELEAIGYLNPLAWHKTVGLTGPEKQAIQRVVKKLQAANLRAQVESINEQQ